MGRKFKSELVKAPHVISGRPTQSQRGGPKKRLQTKWKMLRPCRPQCYCGLVCFFFGFSHILWCQLSQTSIVLDYWIILEVSNNHNAAPRVDQFLHFAVQVKLLCSDSNRSPRRKKIFATVHCRAIDLAKDWKTLSTQMALREYTSSQYLLNYSD